MRIMHESMGDRRTAKERIGEAFKALRREGFRCRANYLCCVGCACAALDEGTRSGQPWVFYTRQDHASLVQFGWDHGEPAQHGCFLAWGVKDGSDYGYGGPSAGDECPADLRDAAERIVAAMQDAGLVVEWNGDPAARIWVQHPEAAAKEADPAAIA
jgi:hypothetical protein